MSKKWKIKKSVKLIQSIEKRNISSYVLSESQVEAILELRLQKLTAFGISEIETEINDLSKLITKYNKLLSSKDLYKLISNELINIKDKFSIQEEQK